MESSVFKKSFIFNNLRLLLHKGGKILGDFPCKPRFWRRNGGDGLPLGEGRGIGGICPV